MMTSNFVGDRLVVRTTLLKCKAATAEDAVSESSCWGVPFPRKLLGFRVAKRPRVTYDCDGAIKVGRIPEIVG